MNSIKWSNDPSVLVIHFEELVGPCGGGDFDIQVSTVQNLAHHIGYNISYQRAVNISKKLFGGTTTFAVGKIRRWKEVYDEELMDEFKNAFGEHFKELGYDYEIDYLDLVRDRNSRALD
ncbi:hypothetical protein COB11_00940 [Candidatus Aerophobetes bacterium]|uniref:Uncharacterized protein n=1 Tax=Aerophobetes bacterium TaxID=2030807 RepID=A0A2A4YLZ2_UNCAE|nr:MAG: hypothetical protein COB11_00940 [Candidatus Aerophobetes bacterium]